MRPSWDEQFMKMCDVASERATCDRKHVGAVLVRDKRIIGSGYNGSLPGYPHCDDPEVFFECLRCGHKHKIPTKRADGHGFVCDQPLCGGEVEERHGGHDMEDGHCVRTVHAEVNAVCQAARLGIPTEGATLYCNTLPCWNCFKTIISAGIKEIVYRDEYRPDKHRRVHEATKMLAGFTLRQFQPPPTE